MRLFSVFRARFRSLFRRRQLEVELEEEFQYHFDRGIEEARAAGMSEADAREAALRAIRDLEQRKEECRDARGVNLIENAAHDIRFALRQLRNSPGFTCAALFVLGLGLAAAVAIFSLVDAALIRPLPYADQSRVMAVFETSSTDSRSIVSFLNLDDWQRRNHVFSSISGVALNGSFTLTTRSGAEQVAGTRVSPSFFRTLGVKPLLGHDFRYEEDRSAASVIISYPAWQKRYGGRRDVLGTSVTLNGLPSTIIGILPRDFQFAIYPGADFWGTLRESDVCEKERGCNNLIALGRLRAGVSIETAASEMSSIVRRLRREYPKANFDFTGANLVPIRDLIFGNIRPILIALMGGAGLLLLIAAVNVTALLLARSEKRRTEVSVRAALGASRSRLIRQFATEGFLLSSFSAVFALGIAESTLRILRLVTPATKMDTMPYFSNVHVGGESLIFCGTAVAVVTMLFATVPSARISTRRLMDGLTKATRGSSAKSWRGFGSSLVVAEVAIAMVLMIAGCLLSASLYHLLSVDLGFVPDHLQAVQTSWAPDRYTSDPEIALEHRIMERVSKLPGVQAVAISNAPPVESAWGTSSFHVVGRANRGENNEVLNRHVSPSYFATLEAPVLDGRSFSEHDDVSAPLVVVVNKTFARKYFPGMNPVGQQIYWDWQPNAPMQIIGVVSDIKEGTLTGENWPAVYVSYRQVPWAWPAVLIRTSGLKSISQTEIAHAVHSIDPFITVSEFQSITERIKQAPSTYLHRSAAWIMGTFASIAFTLSIVGLYALVAYSVNQRLREIGIRIALGAENRDVRRLVLAQAAWVTMLGTAMGVCLSACVANLLKTLLFGVGAWDPLTYAGVACGLGVVALLAAYVPARRASSISPTEALRAE